ncbi:MAG TPA: hypothetical protein DCP61_05490, partial [Treponema sp.]|nr:hypothetical protein [Treponema sp.]
HRANAFLPRFQPTFQCFRTLLCYIAFHVRCTYLLQVLEKEKIMLDTFAYNIAFTVSCTEANIL